MFSDLDASTILGIVAGPVRAWPVPRPRRWLVRLQLVAMDMSAEYRAAVRTPLPRAEITVDHFRFVARVSQMITYARRRQGRFLHGRRGSNSNPAYRHRRLLTCNQETSPRSPVPARPKSSKPVNAERTLTPYRRADSTARRNTDVVSA
ncbi:transposase [Kocuria sp. UCD-OTCP]|uniref:transposase n=1 Tax=Kocuria sp. UCD-OTCP TaxID=1292021 RepID=UPI0012378878|nr:transposase [Kocuria sp. UCD-OTCP]